MYYYGFSKLMKKQTKNTDNVFRNICAYLVSEECPLLNVEPSEEIENVDFSAGLQVTGLIAYSAKHLRADKFDKYHQRLISGVVDKRLE
jgi:hypothetical protein